MCLETIKSNKGRKSYIILMKHLAIIRLDRIVLHIWKHYASDHPEQLLFLESDKQASNTTTFPFYNRYIKNTENEGLLKFSIYAMLLNGQSFIAYINLPVHIPNSNNAITCRWLFLRQYSHIHNGLPSVIKCLTDSSASENKSKSIITFWCWMVMTAKTTFVNLYFPNVGHSHAGCDGLFGNISTSLRKNAPVNNFDQFKNILSNIKFKNGIDDQLQTNGIFIVGETLNWDQFWIDMKINDIQNSLNGIQKWRNVYICKSEARNGDDKSYLHIFVKDSIALRNAWVGETLILTYEYTKNDIIERTLNTPLYFDFTKYIEVDQMHDTFLKWLNYSDFTEKDYLSWKCIFTKMKSLQNMNCSTCLQLKIKKQR